MPYRSNGFLYLQVSDPYGGGGHVVVCYTDDNVKGRYNRLNCRTLHTWRICQLIIELQRLSMKWHHTRRELPYDNWNTREIENRMLIRQNSITSTFKDKGYTSWVFIHCFVTLSLFHWITIFILSLIRYWDFYWLFALVTNFDLRAIGLAITVQCQIKFSMLLQRTYRTCTQENGKGRPSWNN